MPIYSAPVSVTFTELLGTTAHNPAGSAAWEDWDISGSVGSDSVIAAIRIFNNGGGSQNVGIRTNGSALNRYYPMEDNTYSETWLVQTDTNGVIEIYTGANHASFNFYVIGYIS